MTYTYQWLRYDGDIVGETSSTISFSPLREADVGRYNCRVSDGSMTITSDGVVINVQGECCMGSTVTFRLSEVPWDLAHPFTSLSCLGHIIIAQPFAITIRIV